MSPPPRVIRPALAVEYRQDPGARKDRRWTCYVVAATQLSAYGASPQGAVDALHRYLETAGRPLECSDVDGGVA